MSSLAAARLPSPSVVHFRDLGPLVVEQDGRVRPVGGARLEAALAILLINADRPVGPGALSEAMWGAQSSPRSVATLDSHIYRLRQLLEPDRRPGMPSKALLRSPGGFRLVAATDQVDSLRFARLATDAADLLVAGSPDRSLRRTVEALTLWRGRPFGEAADEPWAAATVGRLEELKVQVEETKIGALLATGATEPALADLEVALVEHPLRERLWAYRMIAYRDSGRRAEALAAYSAARSVLVDELGIEPGSELRDLHAALLSEGGDPPSGDGRGVMTSRPKTAMIEVHGGAPHRPTVGLPVPRDRLVGRSGELAALSASVRTRPMTTLVGSAGCGKTRLAVEVGATVAADFPDGVWFVDLTSATPDRVLDTVTSTIELPVSPTGNTLAMLRSFARDRRLLLVLDNCEHVLDAAAELVEQIVVQDAELAVLATSREPLDVRGEHVVPLQPLSTTGPDSAAASLFLERLADRFPGTALDPEARDRAVEVAIAVDGLPLALELAAGRAGAYSLSEIVTQVRADASSLGRVGRGHAAHHSTIREAIDTSYRALSAPEAAMHRAVAVVLGPFTGDLAAALMADEPTSSGPHPGDAADAIAGLVHRSLLARLGPARSGGPSRFAQLATVRGHAAHVAAEVHTAGHDRRDAWVERLIMARPHLGSARQSAWYRELDDDLAAVRATLQHTLIDQPTGRGIALAARLGSFWTFNGFIVEGFGWSRAAMAACENDRTLGAPTDRAMVRITFATVSSLQSQPDVARLQMRAAIAESKRATGVDAELVCADLAFATGPILWGLDAELLGEMGQAASDLTGGSSRSDVVVRHANLVLSILTTPEDPTLPDRLSALYSDAHSSDNLYTAAIAAVGMAQVLMKFRPEESLFWARRAIHDAIALGQQDAYLTAETLGCALACTGDHENALQVLALAEALQVRGGMRWPTIDATATVIEAANAALGREAAERARSRGLTLTLTDLADIGQG